MSLNAVPKLEEISESPALASQLPADIVETLLGKCSVAQGALVGRLLALRASGNGQGQAQPDGDRLLSAREAAAKLGTSADWLYRHSRNLPFTIRIGRKVLFSEAGIERYIRQRMGR
jgi:predicted DNA-binding transcriptional regulator AlpA